MRWWRLLDFTSAGLFGAFAALKLFTGDPVDADVPDPWFRHGATAAEATLAVLLISGRAPAAAAGLLVCVAAAFAAWMVLGPNAVQGCGCLGAVQLEDSDRLLLISIVLGLGGAHVWALPSRRGTTSSGGVSCEPLEWRWS